MRLSEFYLILPDQDIVGSCSSDARTGIFGPMILFYGFDKLGLDRFLPFRQKEYIARYCV